MAGAAAQFECVSKPGAGEIFDRLWDFIHGIPDITVRPRHTFDRAGRYCVTLVVWDTAGRGSRVEKTIEVLPAN